MRTSVPKLRSARLKGGTHLTVLPTASPPDDSPAAKMLRGVRAAAEHMPEASGYFFVLWDDEGLYYRGWSLGGPVSIRLFPSYVAEVAREACVRDDVSEMSDEGAV